MPYYIVPVYQIKETQDSAILIPESSKTIFNLITIQTIIEKEKILKGKEEYIKFSYQAKDKFEELNNIKISEIYFYFILTNEFNELENINKLKKENI